MCVDVLNSDMHVICLEWLTDWLATINNKYHSWHIDWFSAWLWKFQATRKQFSYNVHETCKTAGHTFAPHILMLCCVYCYRLIAACWSTREIFIRTFGKHSHTHTQSHIYAKKTAIIKLNNISLTFSAITFSFSHTNVAWPYKYEHRHTHRHGHTHTYQLNILKTKHLWYIATYRRDRRAKFNRVIIIVAAAGFSFIFMWSLHSRQEMFVSFIIPYCVRAIERNVCYF